MEAFGHTKTIYKYMPKSLATYIPHKDTENVINPILVTYITINYRNLVHYL